MQIIYGALNFVVNVVEEGSSRVPNTLCLAITECTTLKWTVDGTNRSSKS